MNGESSEIIKPVITEKDKVDFKKIVEESPSQLNPAIWNQTDVVPPTTTKDGKKTIKVLEPPQYPIPSINLDSLPPEEQKTLAKLINPLIDYLKKPIFEDNFSTLQRKAWRKALEEKFAKENAGNEELIKKFHLYLRSHKLKRNSFSPILISPDILNSMGYVSDKTNSLINEKIQKVSQPPGITTIQEDPFNGPTEPWKKEWAESLSQDIVTALTEISANLAAKE